MRTGHETERKYGLAVISNAVVTFDLAERATDIIETNFISLALCAKRPAGAGQKKAVLRRAGDETRTRDVLLGKEVLYH